MTDMLKKEVKLSSSILSYLFILFGLMFFLPGYPVLCGPFFVCLGIFQSFQYAREANDIVFSALLPVAKKDVVKGKYQFTCFIELCSIALMLIPMLLRMTVFCDSSVYRQNALMNANLFALGAAFIVFALFNIIFLGGFFKDAYRIGKPFVIFIIVCMLAIGGFEALHHIPGLEALNSFGFENIGLQACMFIMFVISYILLTLLSFKASCSRFEKVDL